MFEFGFGIVWIVLSICVALDLGLDCLEGLVLIVWICFPNVWIVLIVCIASWIWWVCFDCLNWLCDAWAVSFVYAVSLICLGRLGCVCVVLIAMFVRLS